MPRREIKIYFEDIINTGNELIQLHLDAENINSFLSKNYYFRTAERCFQIIGEALYQVNKLNPQISITGKIQIINLRHILSHDYDLVDNARLWLYIEKYLPTLIIEIENYLKIEIEK